MIAQRRDFATAAARGCRWRATRQCVSLRSDEARRLPARGVTDAPARSPPPRWRDDGDNSRADKAIAAGRMAW